jgi:hypothetical protein
LSAILSTAGAIEILTRLSVQVVLRLDLAAAAFAVARYTSPPRPSTFVRVSTSPAFELSLLRTERTVCDCSARAFAISATVAPRGLTERLKGLREMLISTGVGYK